MSKLWTLQGALPEPDLEQLRKQAKELVAAHAAGDPDALAFIRRHHPSYDGRSRLSDAQWAIARCFGDASWPALVHRLESIAWLPLVPIRNLVVFPGQKLTLDVGRPRSLAAIRAALAGDNRLALVAQRAAATAEPSFADLHAIGTVGEIVSVRDVGPGQKVEVAGARRVELRRVAERDGMLVADVAPADVGAAVDPEQVRRSAINVLHALARQLQEPAEHPLATLLTHVNLLPADVQQQILETDDPSALVRALAAALQS